MPQYFEVEVELRGVEPRVWRRFVLSEDATFQDLHEAIQIACGWENYHMFAFRDDRTRKEIAGIPDSEFGDPAPDSRKARLADFLGKARSKTCMYEYDFGDSWEHDVTIRTVTLPETFERRLVGGERAFPPEDCGGLDGYDRYAVAVVERRDPWGEDLDEVLEWVGDWHPERFDLAATRKSFDRKPRASRAPRKKAEGAAARGKRK